MIEELTVEYDAHEIVEIAMVRSVPRKELQEHSDNPIEEADNLKLLYIKDYVDESGFITLQIKRFTLKGETVALIVYGKHMSGVGQVFVHQINHRFYPHLTIVEGIYCGFASLYYCEKKHTGLAGFTENIKTMIKKSKKEEE
jgi:hypothetical protein|tara:strand:- start:1168 stop:1593 length:426 start_codon:yes stop_codon:yes gene_type:complete